MNADKTKKKVTKHRPAEREFSVYGAQFAVLAARFNDDIVSNLITGAIGVLEKHGIVGSAVEVVRVPGAFELPLIAQRLALKGYDAVVCLGAVVEGDTDHYEHVAHRASEGLMRVQLDTGVPVAFGILTVRTEEDAVARSGTNDSNKGRESAIAAVMAANVLRSLDA
jgi:6,7-dimethyl-8-ribityllumazine synthase